MTYTLRANRFNNVHSLTMVINRNYGADHSKIYYIGFTGYKTNKKKFILLGNYELKPQIDKQKTKDNGAALQDMIYG